MILFLSILFVCSFLATWLVRKIALRKSILDIPNDRSSHSVPTPRGGGLAIVITWYLGITYLFINQQIEASFFYAFLSGLFLVIISLIDDIFNLKPVTRIIFQTISAASALYFLGGLHKIDFGIYQLNSSLLLTLPAFVGIIWLINLFNFIDGIDGYAASETIFIFASVFVFFQSVFALVLVVACLGFLLWNWQKAKIFMGDVGSTLLGFNVGVVAVYFQNTDKASIIILLILSSLFWFDATLTLFRRWRNKEKLSQAHRKHAYQRIVIHSFSHQKTVIIGMLLNLLILGFAYIGLTFKILALLVLVVVCLILYLITRQIDKRKSFN